jgi:hypothetical protein
VSWRRRAVDVAIAATAVAGAVAVLRQRAEAAAIRRGELVPASAAADLVPAHHPGRVGDRIAAWSPSPPRTTLGRTAAGLWVAPLSAVGLLLARLGGSRPRWDPTHRCYVAVGVRGPSAVALRAVGAEANTVGQVVLARSPHPSATLLAHEAVHVRQGERLGVLLLPLYVWLGARYGYRDHPLERAARSGAQRRSGPQPSSPR